MMPVRLASPTGSSDNSSIQMGAALYAVQWPFELDDRIWALPISSLWQPPLATS